MVRLSKARFKSPIGEIMVVCQSETLVHLDFSDCMDRLETFLTRRFADYEVTETACPTMIGQPLERYFAGEVTTLDAIPVKTDGTAFQQRVWQALRTIPAGSTTAYRNIAEKIGQPKAVRAVGAANGRNPIALVIPCHRVISADGKLAGYAGGLQRKDWLLRHEGAII